MQLAGRDDAGQSSNPVCLGEWTKVGSVVPGQTWRRLPSSELFSDKSRDRCSHTQPGKADCADVGTAGGVPDRPAEICLQLLLTKLLSGEPSSGPVDRAGRRAGEILQETRITLFWAMAVQARA